jgi:hypothetical protein
MIKNGGNREYQAIHTRHRMDIEAQASGTRFHTEADTNSGCTIRYADWQ